MNNVKLVICSLLVILVAGCATRVKTNKFRWHDDLTLQSISGPVEREYDLTLALELRLYNTPSTAQDPMVQESLYKSLVGLLRSQGMFRQIVAFGSTSDALLRVDLTYTHSAVDELQKLPLALLTLFIYTPSRVDSRGKAKAIITSRFSQDSLTDEWWETGKGTTPTGLFGHGDAMAKSIKALSSKLLPRVSDFVQANSSFFDQILIAKKRQEETAGYASYPQRKSGVDLTKLAITDAKEKLAVMDLQAKYGVEQRLAEGLSVVVRDAIQGFGHYEVLSKDDVEVVAKRTAIRQSLGCDDTQCLIDIGRSLGSRFMVAGAISKFGNTYNVSLRLIDTVGKDAGVKRRINRNCKCVEDELIEAAKGTARQLLE